MITLQGKDAARFAEELREPNEDPRRLSHLAASNATYLRLFSSEPIRSLDFDAAQEEQER